ncbi:MAG: hypothetical protein R3C49_07275, partial [Planctomycetaceae bacterium]
VSTTLQILEVLPCDAMAALLADELRQRGFQDVDGTMVRTEDGITIVIDPQTATVRVSADVNEEVELKQRSEGWADDDWGRIVKKKTEERLREQARKALETAAGEQEKKLTEQATEQLEKALRDLQSELDGVVNRVTAAALKQKAAQIGEIKQVTEDTETGSMTIVLEV